MTSGPVSAHGPTSRHTMPSVALVTGATSGIGTAEHGRAFAAAIPGAIVLIPHGGYLSQLEASDELRPAIAELVASPGDGPPRCPS